MNIKNQIKMNYLTKHIKIEKCLILTNTTLLQIATARNRIVIIKLITAL